MLHVRDFVRRHSRATGFFLRGENLSIFTDGNPRRPITNFAPHMLDGFREFMRFELGGVDSLLALRWGISGLTFASMNIRGPHWNDAVARDFITFQQRLNRELVDRHYTEAKSARAEGWYANLSFGVAGMERSSIDSDFASSGNYYDDEQVYYGGGKNSLAAIADAARLSGKPVAFGLSSPPFTKLQVGGTTVYLGPPAWPWFRKCFRWIKPTHVDLYFREVMTAAVSHVSYIKAFGFGLLGVPSVVQTVNDGIARMAGLRQRSLEFMGPFQRVAIQAETLDGLDVAANAASEPSAHLSWRLSSHLRARHVPCALFSDPTMFVRTFPRWQLRGNLTFVCFPRQASAAAVIYGEALPVRSPGVAVIVVDTATAVTVIQDLARGGGSLGPPTQLVRQSDSAYYARITLNAARGPSQAYLLAFRNQRVGEAAATYLEACAALIDQEFARFAPGLVVRPAAPRPIPGAELYSNCVTDGVNSLVGVSWAAQGTQSPQPLTLDIEPAWRSRFDPSVVAGFRSTLAAGNNTLGPEETSFFYVEAQLNPSVVAAIQAGGMQAVISAFRAVLTQLDNGFYQVEHGRSLLDNAAALLGRGHLSRALAGLAALSRMVFLNVTRSGTALDVKARTAWGNGAPASTPVAIGEVQVILPLNAHEVQPPLPLTNGSRVLTIASPRRFRWNFNPVPPNPPSFYLPPLAEVDAVVEVHVTDQDTGAHGFVRV